MSDRAKVELRPAFAYDCDECGRECFVNGVVPELTDDEIQELRDEHGIQPWETGDWMMMSTVVICPHCHAEFVTQQYE